MVKLFEEEIHIMQLFYANQSIRNVRDISNATHDRPIPSIGTIFNIISKSLVFGIVGCIATHNALICVMYSCLVSIHLHLNSRITDPYLVFM
jgi:hypothetical protein